MISQGKEEPYFPAFLREVVFMNREELILLANHYYEKARRIESQIKWQNSDQRDSLIGKRDKALFNGFWYDVQAKELR